MKYDLSDIMKHAWNLKRKVAKWNFSTCLKKAWVKAKAKAQTFTVIADSITKETAKALCLNVILTCFSTGQRIARNVWLPKSQITGGAIPAWLLDAKLDDLRDSINHPATVQVDGLVDGFITC